MSGVDLLVVGAGPAGMAAAVAAQRLGLTVLVIDEQQAPGGQIWRSVEQAVGRDTILGPAYFEGRDATGKFRASGVVYEPGTQLWQIEQGFRAFVSRDGQARRIEAKAIVVATGAQERPVPFPGWTLPGVLTVGAAQILLKNAGQVPSAPVWIAGSGPLPLLYAMQLLSAGGRIAGFLDTTPSGQWRTASRYVPRALLGWRDLVKGVGWSRRLRRGADLYVAGVSDIEAVGEDRIRALRYRARGGDWTTVDAGVLLVHEGVVPSVHPALSLACEVAWDGPQECFKPVVDAWGESSKPNLFFAGDGAGIAGAKAAQFRGSLAALRVAVKLGRVSDEAIAREARSQHRGLKRELAVRPFLDAMFRPRRQVFEPVDETIVCRCEGTTAGEIRSLAVIGQPGPNQIKAATRAGMGPCQGRQCGYTVTRLLAAAQHGTPAETGFFHIRPPLKPVTLGELATLRTPKTVKQKARFISIMRVLA